MSAMNAMSYGYIGTMKARPGHRDEVVALLLDGVEGLREIGCELYVVGLADDDEDTICVTEVWQSKADHDASLQRPEVRAAIERAMPLLTGEFTSREVRVAGGLGV
jgi:quinol monooxygenase YgiN